MDPAAAVPAGDLFDPVAAGIRVAASHDELAPVIDDCFRAAATAEACRAELVGPLRMGSCREEGGDQKEGVDDSGD